MRQLDSGLHLSSITIPGTHDSATRFVGLPLFSRCQSKTILDQLESGYRYLDIRLGVKRTDDGKRLALMHGFTSCKTRFWPWSDDLYLEGVLDACVEFLKAHPDETVIFAVKQEHGDDSVAEFQNLLNEVMQKYSANVLFTDSMPTLGQARGKIVLARRYEDKASLGVYAGLPLIWEDQGGHANVSLGSVTKPSGVFSLTVQDRYEYDEIDKWSAFENTLGVRPDSKDNILLNFLSTKGTLKYGHPYYFAARLNNHLRSREIPENSGWIIVDFGDAALAKCIYGVN